MKNLLYIFIIPILLSCGSENYTPKPYGYFRIDFPEKQYVLFDTTCPFAFEHPSYSVIVRDKDANTEPCWFNIVFRNMKATIHLSYKSVDNNIAQYLEDSRTLAYKHTVKADAINEKVFSNKKKSLYGMLYEIEGNAASPAQFFVTDSSSHFLRGALYFNVPPNKDSLKPVIEFIREDIVHLVESVYWKE